jgi:amino-acid N-acetyltransferase
MQLAVRAEVRCSIVQEFGIRPAEASDLRAVSALVVQCGLPLEGLASRFGEGYAVAESRGALAGAAGVEVYGPDGLLRSVAVSPAQRGTGMGTALVRDRIAWARTRGLRALYLLTTTAVDYFPRLGFQPAVRDEAPAGIRASEEFAHACPASATLMKLAL